jgi:hypothetical protein
VDARLAFSSDELGIQYDSIVHPPQHVVAEHQEKGLGIGNWFVGERGLDERLRKGGGLSSDW